MFRRKPPEWEKVPITRPLRHLEGRADPLLLVVWGGLVGLLFNCGTLFGIAGIVEVEKSTHLTATCLIWIGGMILFGIGALLSRSDFDGERPLADDHGDVRIRE